MSILSRLALLFIGVPLLELFVLIQLGQVVGLWPTIGLVVLTGFCGAALARLEGLRTIWKIQGELAHGHLPGDALLDGMAILLGGGLLLTPGILTDLVGLAFLFPPTRRPFLGRIRKSLKRRLQSGAIRVTHVGGLSGSTGFSWSQGASQDEASPPSPGEIVIEADKGDPL